MAGVSKSPCVSFDCSKSPIENYIMLTLKETVKDLLYEESLSAQLSYEPWFWSSLQVLLLSCFLPCLHVPVSFFPSTSFLLLFLF